MSQLEEKIDGRTILKLYKNLKNKLDEIENEKKNKFSELDEDIKKKSDVYDELLQKMAVLENNKVNPILQSLNDKIIELEEKQNELINLYQEKLDQNDNEIENTKQEISQLFEEQKELKNEAEALKNEILENKNSSEELFNEIDEYHDELLTNDQSIKKELEKIHNQFVIKKDKIDTYYTELFEYQNKFLNNKLSPEEYENLSTEEKEKYSKNNEGMYQEISKESSIYKIINETKEEFFEALKNFKADSNKSLIEREKEHVEIIKKYKEEINALLPGATAAGLSESFQKKIKEQIIAGWIWIVIFFLCLLGMFCMINSFVIPHFNEINSLLGAVIQFIKVISINFPFIWLALVSLKNISQSHRLYEEYCHKKAISQTYVGMKNDIGKIADGDENLNKLITNYISSVFYNPSETLDKKHGVETPVILLSSLLKELKDMKEINSELKAEKKKLQKAQDKEKEE